MRYPVYSHGTWIYRPLPIPLLTSVSFTHSNPLAWLTHYEPLFEEDKCMSVIPQIYNPMKMNKHHFKNG